MHSPSIGEEPRDIGNSMSMLLHTRESTVVIVSYLIHCDIYYIMRWISLKNATKVWYYYKMQQKFITKCIRFFITKCDILLHIATIIKFILLAFDKNCTGENMIRKLWKI